MHGFISLGFGSMILAFHRVWSGIPAVLTVVGVLYLVKTLQCFVSPAVPLRSLQRVTLERSRMFMAPGVAFVALALFVAYGLARAA